MKYYLKKVDNEYIPTDEGTLLQVEDGKDSISFPLMGYRHLKAKTPLSISQKVRLVTEPFNVYDPYAIAIYLEDTKIGYVPKCLTGLVYGCQTGRIHSLLVKDYPTINVNY